MTRPGQGLSIGVGMLILGGMMMGCGLLSRMADALGGGAGRKHTIALADGPGAIAPASTGGSRECPPEVTALGYRVLEDWAGKTLGDWERQAKVTVPRVMLAKLHLGRDVSAVNEMLRQARPHRGSGSTWQLGPLGHLGDYDFTEVTLTTLLYQFGDCPERLSADTVRHLLDVLLLEEGGTPRLTVPGSFGLVIDTENHHLMTEGSRYLKNQWLRMHGSPDPRHHNTGNGLEAWLASYLEAMRREGVYEFNSNPYVGYTIQALLNLEAFADSRRVASRARHLLDEMNWQYALGSLDLRRFPPFRRQLRRADMTSLIDDPHTQMMRVWTCPADLSGQPLPALGSSHQAVIAAALPYRPPADVIRWTREKEGEYLAIFGRGPLASPEIYSGGPSYLISAGGVHRGRRSMIVARPTVLLLRDGATDLKDCFRLPGQGGWRSWNNTGVHARFACSNAPVDVPETYRPQADDNGWAVYTPYPDRGPVIATYSRPDRGLLLVIPETERSPTQVLSVLSAANGNDQSPRHRCTLVDGTVVEYDVDAPKGTWPIISIDGRPANRDYDAWPRFSGDVPDVTFER